MLIVSLTHETLFATLYGLLQQYVGLHACLQPCSSLTGSWIMQWVWWSMGAGAKLAKSCHGNAGFMPKSFCCCAEFDYMQNSW
jgi:hypothetical protein